jgi:histidine triad (HIT) family protein
VELFSIIYACTAGAIFASMVAYLAVAALLDNWLCYVAVHYLSRSLRIDLTEEHRVAVFQTHPFSSLVSTYTLRMSTIFDKIISGEIPSYKIYEDDHVLAFLDIGPLSRGHTLVIPKERAVRLDQLSDESAAAIGRVLPRLCRAVMQAVGGNSYNVLQNNGGDAHQAVMHVHFHIIPKIGDEGLGLRWNAGKLDQATAKGLVAKITAAL